MKKEQWDNQSIAELLENVSAAYTIADEEANKFKIIAYDRAATAIEHLTSEAKDLWDDKKLDEIPGVGGSIAGHLDELFRTGRVKHFEELTKGLPPSLFELLKLEGVGPKIAFKLSKVLRIKEKENALFLLKKAAEKGKIREIPGFGEDSEKRILAAVNTFLEKKRLVRRLFLFEADAVAEEISSYLKKNPGILEVSPLGSIRRRCATVGDIDIAVRTENPLLAIEKIKKMPLVTKTMSQGEKKVSVKIKNNLQIDFRISDSIGWGAMLQYFTGSKYHNIALRERALKKGWSLSEYGIKNVKSQMLNVKDKYKNLKLFRFSNEEKFYSFLGMKYIEPELRENSGEIEAALSNTLPQLVRFPDIKGDLHIHSDFHIETSHDVGASSMETVVKLAAEMNYQYIGFAEHNPSRSKHSEEQTLRILKKKNEYVLKRRGFWKKRFNIFVLNGLEIDIRPDGTLAVPEKAFDFLDFAIVSIHNVLKGEREKQTARVIKALSVHPKVKILGHPTGRLLNEREGSELNWEKIFDFCLKNRKIVEINAWPNRLDLPDVLVREAIKTKVRMIINTDSHSVEQLKFMPYGVGVARRGWAERKDIINTLPFTEFCKVIGTSVK